MCWDLLTKSRNLSNIYAYARNFLVSVVGTTTHRP